jgi:hypothetical protein
LFPFISTVKGLAVPDASPVQPEKSKSVFGVAVITTSAFWLYLPPAILTVPPAEAVTSRVKVIVGATRSSTLSLEQEFMTNIKQRKSDNVSAYSNRISHIVELKIFLKYSFFKVSDKTLKPII